MKKHHIYIHRNVFARCHCLEKYIAIYTYIKNIAGTLYNNNSAYLAEGYRC